MSRSCGDAWHDTAISRVRGLLLRAMADSKLRLLTVAERSRWLNYRTGAGAMMRLSRRRVALTTQWPVWARSEVDGDQPDTVDGTPEVYLHRDGDGVDLWTGASEPAFRRQRSHGRSRNAQGCPERVRGVLQERRIGTTDRGPSTLGLGAKERQGRPLPSQRRAASVSPVGMRSAC